MKILGNRLLVKRCEEEVKEGFKTVDVQDNFVYKGVVVQTCLEAFKLEINDGSIIIFTKYSPDTHEVDVKGEKMKIVELSDVLAVL